MSEKIVGYLLLAIGLLIIAYSGFSVYSVFTKKNKPIDLFALTGISLDIGSLTGGDSASQQTGMPSREGVPAKTELVSPEIINTPLNLVAHLMLMGFVATVGYKIASLGVMLLRPIKVKLKAAKISPPSVPKG